MQNGPVVNHKVEDANTSQPYVSGAIGSALAVFDKVSFLRSPLVPYVVYAVVAGILGWMYRDALNPDAVSYLRNAEHIVEGRFALSVSGYWSPMLSWLLAIPVALGLEGPYAARLVLFGCGLGLVAASRLLISRLPCEQPWLKAGASVCIALIAARMSIVNITPDLLLSTVLFLYFSVLLSPRFFQGNLLAALAGLLGGIAYLTKSYGLPFFVVHMPGAVFLLGMIVGASLMARIRVAAVAMLIFVLTTGGWIANLSSKYGKPTFSTVAPVAHAVIGPDDMERGHPWARTLVQLSENRMASWETPEILEYNFWSPFESRDYFIHQVKHSLGNFKDLLKHIGQYDLCHLALPMFVFLPLLALGGSRDSDQRDRLRYVVFQLCTIIVYSGGFMIVYFEPRYVDMVFMPLAIISGLCVAPLLLERYSRSEQQPQWTSWVFAIAFGLCFLVAEANRWVESLGRDAPRWSTISKSMARHLETEGVKGPFSTDLGYGDLGLYTAFFLNDTFVGCPPSVGSTGNDDPSPESMTLASQLDKFGVATFIAASQSERAAELLANPEWTQKTSKDLEDGSNVSVFTRRR